MSRTPIILDCDPGQDDAVALLLAMAARDKLDILGITTVAGNVPLALTEKNARMIAELAGANDIEIYAGCDKPMELSLITAENVHGSTGLDGMDLFEPAQQLASGHAVDFIIKTLHEHDNGSVVVIPTGPTTNIGAALKKDPSIAKKMKQIILMGGAMREGGNITPSAEFNAFIDPHALDVVLKSGVPVVMHGLDVTHKVLCTPERLAAIKRLGTKVSEAVYGMLTFFNRFDSTKYGTEGAPLHDPCTVSYVLAPELFKTKLCNVSVGTNDDLARGHTAVDFWHVTDKPKNVLWAYDVDADAFFAMLTNYLGTYSDNA